MSEENVQEVASNDEGQGQEIDWKAEVERLRSTNERLLAESQANKTRKSELETYKTKLEAIEAKKLEEQGNWQERLEMEQKKTAELNRRLEDQANKILKGNVYNAVANAAKDAYDVGDLLAQSDYAKMIEVNEETLEPTKESIHNFVNSLKENKNYLFKGKKVAPMADSKPGIDKPLNKTFNQMNANEKQKAFGDAIAKAFQPRG